MNQEEHQAAMEIDIQHTQPGTAVHGSMTAGSVKVPYNHILTPPPPTYLADSYPYSLHGTATCGACS